MRQIERHGVRQKNMNSYEKKKMLPIGSCCISALEQTRESNWSQCDLQVQSDAVNVQVLFFEGIFFSKCLFFTSETSWGYTFYLMEIHLEGSLAVTTDILSH